MLVDILVLNFSKIDKKIAKLDAQEEELDAFLDANKRLVEQAIERIRIAYKKRKRLIRAKRLLKQKEQEIFN